MSFSSCTFQLTHVVVFTRKAAVSRSIGGEFCLGFFTTVDSQTHPSGLESSLTAELIKRKHVTALLLLSDCCGQQRSTACGSYVTWFGKFKGEHHETPEFRDLNQLLSDDYRTKRLLINLLLNIIAAVSWFQVEIKVLFLGIRNARSVCSHVM